LYPILFVSTLKNVRGGHKNPKISKKEKNGLCDLHGLLGLLGLSHIVLKNKAKNKS
jgi:hypothetical protein